MNTPVVCIATVLYSTEVLYRTIDRPAHNTVQLNSPVPGPSLPRRATLPRT